MSTLLETFRSNYSATLEEELSLDEYLDLCKGDPGVYASAAERMLAALDATRARGKIGVVWPTEIVEPGTVVHEMRRTKSVDEIALLRRAFEP